MSTDDELRAQLDDLLGADTDTDSVLAAFERAPSLLAVCEGPDLVITALNDAARQVYGDRVGQPVAEALQAPDTERIRDWTEQTFRTGRPVVDQVWRVAAVEGDDVDGWLSFSMVPSRAGDGTVRGVVTQAVDVTERELFRIRAEQQVQDLQHRLDLARDNLVDLHDALLPEGLPLAPGVELAARYLLAEDGARAGGDWFDAIALPDGRIVVVVGDVVGHGVRATVVMGELRTLFEERVRPDGDLVAALELLERRAGRVPQARAATVCAALIDPEAGTLTYCTAGHPPPLVVSAAGGATYLPVTGSGALGSGLPFVLAEHRLAVDDIVLLYSDGLVERPGRSPGENTLDLARVAADAVRQEEPGGGERVVQRLARAAVEQLTASSGYDDDITVLAVRRVRLPEPLQMTVPAFPDTLRAVRQNLGDWLADLGVGQIDELALQHAVGELVSNSVEHAYEPERSRQEAIVSVTACLVPGGLVEIEVADRGTWRRPGPAGGRGRGLAMASGFTDDLHVTHDAHGTRAVLRQRPSTPVDLLKGTATAAVVTSAPMEMEHDGTIVRLRGTLDHRSADELRRRLSHATRGGTIGVVVDLGGVTHLGSAGVQVLYDEMIPGRDDGSGLTLVAPAGSPAQHVLELVRLPYASDHEVPPAT
ncbi:SpoIIE family protein phosphatase [Nocardioides lianchengensis]|uniref:Anti-anti-sigma factor n=1 Tax=Nocardioides lianchengensis TaxID=1045774 RepID=A0A1G6WSV9_9ACTN|nr:SpoIIE family protein phosphatase [Nocardioides lianchengensis]NYG09211.1 anti-anti-sigma factor [Nocardioides lianchengensis]SDD68901.1 anti-anti-sigma factor [Nocardioides lianchengensis]